MLPGELMLSSPLSNIQVGFMTRSEIVQVLVKLARKVFDDEELEFSESTLFDDIDAWDSMNHVHMVVAMERRFGVRFGIGDLRRVVRVADLVDVIERQRQVSA